MAIKGVNPNALIEYILDCEKEDNETNPTIFFIKSLTGADSSAEAADLFNTQKIIRQGRNAQVVKYSPEKWEEMMINKFCRIVKKVANYAVYDEKKDIYLFEDFEGEERIRLVAQTLAPAYRDEVIGAADASWNLTDGEKKS